MTDANTPAAEPSCDIILGDLTCTTAAALAPGDSVSWLILLDVSSDFAPATLSNTATLATLPVREKRAGYAEVVKYGLIDDLAFFEWCEANGAALSWEEQKRRASLSLAVGTRSIPLGTSYKPGTLVVDGTAVSDVPDGDRGESAVTVRDGLVIGLVQCFSLVPGVSRSGATISAGLFRGIDRVTATRLSFFLAIPALTAAGLYEAATTDLSNLGKGQMAVGIVVAFVVAYASIAWLLRFVATNTLRPFVWYRVALAVLLVGALATGLLAAT